MAERPKDGLPTLKALVAFEAALRLGSLSAAARALSTTQPAISQRIRGLEEAVGQVLFERGGGGLQPTREGLRFYDEIAPALKTIEGSIQALRSRAESTRPRVLVAADFGFAHLWLLPRLARLEELVGGAEFEVIAADRRDEPTTRVADISIQFDERAQGVERFYPERVFPVCSPAFARRHGLSADAPVSAWSALPLLHMDRRNPRWMDWRRWSRLAGHAYGDPGRLFSYNNYPLLIAAAEAGEGIALGWSPLVGDLLREGRLMALGPTVTRASHGYAVETRHADSSLLRRIVDWVDAELGGGD
ncbi:LysR family transcriptional regulator [Halomonas nitroreducens]|uniref:LysR family transcriptional regulator n=1 Tax=Halomonas nitroreducens TaxID=447425 RepID=A0A3S0HQU9_9GAMM|nr:LysR family transcriptional regulator [Halomonas nitroreducens]RTQ98561.1 LysR family transcriptional regulator [Halomonas nitroreducens]